MARETLNELTLMGHGDIVERVTVLYKAQNNISDLPEYYSDLTVNNIVWDDTLEGSSFWHTIYEGNFEIFYRKYPASITDLDQVQAETELSISRLEELYPHLKSH